MEKTITYKDLALQCPQCKNTSFLVIIEPEEGERYACATCGMPCIERYGMMVRTKH